MEWMEGTRSPVETPGPTANRVRKRMTRQADATKERKQEGGARCGPRGKGGGGGGGVGFTLVDLTYEREICGHLMMWRFVDRATTFQQLLYQIGVCSTKGEEK